MSEYDLPLIHRGSDYAFDAVWGWDCSDGEQIIDVTGYTATLTFRKRGRSHVELQLTSASGRITITGVEGKFAWRLTDTDTNGLREGIYEYELVVTSPTGDTSVLLAGNAEVRG